MAGLKYSPTFIERKLHESVYTFPKLQVSKTHQFFKPSLILLDIRLYFLQSGFTKIFETRFLDLI